jgi:RNA polymerase-binding transcription factor DksA
MSIVSEEQRRPIDLPDSARSLLRTLLLRRLAEHAAQAADYRLTVDELIGESDANSLLERELADASAMHYESTMGEVRAALERLDAGTYGLCEACGTAIPLERLEAMPHARRCVRCPEGPVGLLG